MIACTNNEDAFILIMVEIDGLMKIIYLRKSHVTQDKQGSER